jgi:hypothetical protein
MLSLAYWEIPSSAKIAGISPFSPKVVALRLYLPKPLLRALASGSRSPSPSSASDAVSTAGVKMELAQ